jgi:hypothetical protein
MGIEPISETGEAHILWKQDPQLAALVGLFIAHRQGQSEANLNPYDFPLTGELA